MKFFALIMSCYLLVLSCCPCSDRLEDIVRGTQKISVATQQSAHYPYEDACTPFCNCSCCPASAFYQALPYIGTISPAFQSPVFYSYSASFCSEDILPVWQPPKFS